MLPLVRIPCILVATVGFHVAATPPNPPPAEEERVPSTKLEVLLGYQFTPLIIKSICWGAAFAETAVILANYKPSLPISQTVLSNLIFVNGSGTRIHPSPLFFVGSFLAALGGWIRYKCYRELGDMFTYEMSIRKNHLLVTSGPYSVVRHPGYTGAVITFLGISLLHGVEGSWLRESGALEIKFMKGFTAASVGLFCTISFGLLQRMFKEDKALHQRCGKEWEDWARRVPCRLIPWVF